MESERDSFQQTRENPVEGADWGRTGTHCPVGKFSCVCRADGGLCWAIMGQKGKLQWVYLGDLFSLQG